MILASFVTYFRKTQIRCRSRLFHGVSSMQIMRGKDRLEDGGIFGMTRVSLGRIRKYPEPPDFVAVVEIHHNGPVNLWNAIGQYVARIAEGNDLLWKNILNPAVPPGCHPGRKQIDWCTRRLGNFP
jgi:hypothetical protein